MKIVVFKTFSCGKLCLFFLDAKWCFGGVGGGGVKVLRLGPSQTRHSASLWGYIAPSPALNMDPLSDWIQDNPIPPADGCHALDPVVSDHVWESMQWEV